MSDILVRVIDAYIFYQTIDGIKFLYRLTEGA